MYVHIYTCTCTLAIIVHNDNKGTLLTTELEMGR